MKRVARHAVLRGLVGVFVFDTSLKRVDANVTANNQIVFIPPTQEMLDMANKGELVVIPPREGGNVVRALIKLQNFPSHYLYVYRTFEPFRARTIGEDARSQGRV